jgi:hypothetical protein
LAVRTGGGGDDDKGWCWEADNGGDFVRASTTCLAWYEADSIVPLRISASNLTTHPHSGEHCWPHTRRWEGGVVAVVCVFSGSDVEVGGGDTPLSYMGALACDPVEVEGSGAAFDVAAVDETAGFTLEDLDST